jgi:hypothetical protein
MIDVEPLIRDELELLAPSEHVKRDWADALRRSGARGTRTPRRVALAAALAAAIAAGLAVLPGRIGDHRVNVLDAALAAISRGPVLHAVLVVDASETWRGPSGHPTFATLDLATGAQRPVRQTTEIWFDAQRHRLHQLSRVDGGVVADALQTPTLLRDSWRLRDLPGSRPAIDPALQAALRGYRAALRSGTARVAARAHFRGRPVIWIRFRGAAGTSQEVGVAPMTFRPLFLRAVCPRCTAAPPTYTIRRLEGVRRADANFRLPPRAPAFFGRYANQEVRAIDPSQASRLLGAHALWAGRSVAGLPLSLTQFVNASQHSRLPIRKGNAVGRSYGIRLLYNVDVQANGGWRVPAGRRSVSIVETTDFRFGIGSFAGFRLRFPTTLARAPIPRWPSVALSAFDPHHWTLQTKRGRLYVEIGAPTRGLAVAVAKALRPVP